MNTNAVVKKTFFVGVCLLLIVLVKSEKVHSYTLEEIMSSSFPSHLTVSPTGNLVAWVFNREGKRNLWVAEAPDYRARQLTDYSFDDGQPIEGPAFSADGSILVYVRGDVENRAGENPNPTSNPRGAEQAVWAVKIKDGQSWRLGKGNDPQTSPVENRIVLHYRGKIYSAFLKENGEEPKLLFKARGENVSSTWSPDGTRLAFVSHREDHSFIGIYHLKENRIIWVSPSVDRDVLPVWSSCGKFIAFIRFPGMSGFSYGGTGGLKFSVWVADSASGRAEEIWTCPNETGGFAQDYPAHPLRWAADDNLILYSEHEGWMHLYSLSVNEKKIIDLTPGEHEVEHSFLSADRKTLIFNSNSGDIDRRHIWIVPVTGGKTKAITEGTGIEWSPVLTSESSHCLFICSTARQPAAPAVLNPETGKKHLIAPEVLPGYFPTRDLVEPQQVIFKSSDGYEIHAQLFLPKEAKAGDDRPAVIFMHGGPIRQMLLGWHYMDYYHHAYAFNQHLAHKGYVVLSVNFRSGIGYGYDFCNAPNQGPRGASEYKDIVAAGRYLQKRPEVDSQKIGLWGGSYGGYLTALGLARDSELFAAGVDFHGVHDWSLRAMRRSGGSWGIHGDDLMKSAFQASPVADVDSWTSPVLFIHGDDDRNVDFVQTTDMVQRLRRAGKAPIELLVIPDEVHGFLRHDIWISVYRATADFFDRMLRNKKE